MTVQFYFVLIILASAIIHATWNALVKASGSRFLTLTVVQSTGTFFGLGLLFFVGLPELSAWPYLLISVALHNLYYIFLLLCYRVGDLSQG